MGAFMPQAPMLPPEIREQQGEEESPQQQPVMAQAGQQLAQQQQGGGASASDPIGLLEQKIAELEKWAQETMQLVEATYKPAGALLIPIAKAGQALKAEIQQIKQRKGSGSAVPGQKPQPNPGEGMQGRQAA